MKNVVQFPRAASRNAQSMLAGNVEKSTAELPASSSQPGQSIGNVVEALSLTLGQIKTLCEMIPDGPLREQLAAERARLVVGLFTARLAAARLCSAGAPPTAVLEVSDWPVTHHH